MPLTGAGRMYEKDLVVSFLPDRLPCRGRHVWSYHLITFTQPYTDPDGTTRRPLAERVPECVPKHDDLVAALDGRILFSPLGYIQRPGEEAKIDGLCESASNDLWCAVAWNWILDHRQREDVTFEWFPSRIDCLNAAAHAVADAMGVMP